jgi:iron complex outermembrane receptor protein
VVVGSVRDLDSGEPIAWVQLLLQETNRSTFSNEEGRFIFRDLPEGAATLQAFRIGYESMEWPITVLRGDTLHLWLSLSVSPIEAGAILIEEEGQARVLATTSHALTGTELRRHLGATIAESLNDEPGVAMRSMGPAPARPVLRGMGGERLLVLEDGERTGDLSSTSADHAVVIEPMTAERVEVYRGPEALLFGSGVLGGVVNVVRNTIPSTMPDRARGSVGAQVESVNRGTVSSVSLEAPLGPFAWRIEGSARRASDQRTPLGTLENTGIATYAPTFGVRYLRPRTSVGAAAGYYFTDYGIPGGFIGAHPNGVTVRLDRRYLTAGAIVTPASAFIQQIDVRADAARYYHREFESNGDLGVEFGVLAYHGSIQARTTPRGRWRHGVVGVWGEYRDYASSGLVFTPRSVEGTLAGFAFQELDLHPISWKGALRFDTRSIVPAEEKESVIGFVRPRRFSGVSAAMQVEWDVGAGFSLGATAMRAIRMPSLEELFSEGPHLAAYSYEVGDPELGNERGVGLEAFVRRDATRTSFRVQVFDNRFTHFIFPRNTGRINVRLLLPMYQTTGASARLVGAEVFGTWHVSSTVSVSAQASSVRGTLTDTGEPLPWMPPLHGRLGVMYHRGATRVGLGLRASAGQERLGAFEEATDGYILVDAFFQRHFMTGRWLHTLDFGLINATDTVYRDHLSRVKSIMPEPGINLKLLYSVFF